MSKRSALIVVVFAVALLPLWQWVEPVTPHAPQTPRLARLDELTEAERRYGLAPQPSDDVVYQPDVVIVEGGADAIRSAGTDGISWTLDPGADGADDLVPGNIMFVTGRAVGRVLDVRPTNEGLRVVVGPVAFTDIVRKSNIELDLPLDLSQLIAYSAPNHPGTALDTPPASSARWHPQPLDHGVVMPARFEVNGHGGWKFAQSPGGSPNDFVIRQLRLTPLIDHNGVGLRLRGNKGGMAVDLISVFHTQTPKIYAVFKDDIYLAIRGATGVRMVLETAGDVVRAVLDEHVSPPVDWSIPILGTPLPLAVTVHHEFRVKSAFAAAGNVEGSGGFELAGELKVGYIGGKLGLTAPKLQPNDSFLRGLRGISLAVNGFTFTHEIKIFVGLGAFFFTTGPYVGVRTAVGLTSGSAVAIIYCKGTDLNVNLVGGIGYAMPQTISDAINTVLSVFNTRIASSGGIKLADLALHTSSATNTTSPICDSSTRTPK